MGSIKVFKTKSRSEYSPNISLSNFYILYFTYNIYYFRASSSLPLLLPPMLMDSGKKHAFNSNLIKIERIFFDIPNI